MTEILDARHEIVSPQPHPGTINVRLRVGRCVRQGDVLIQRVASLPHAAIARSRRDLAPGTQHSHVAEDPAVTYDLPGGEIGIVAEAPFIVSHETHRHFVLGAGTYRTWRQVEAEISPVTHRVIRRRVLD